MHKVPFDAPLNDKDSETQTYGCRQNNPDICGSNGLVGTCAFVSDDKRARLPGAAYKKDRKVIAMADKKIITFPSYNVSLSEAITIVKYKLDDENIAVQTKAFAIEAVAEMETHNSVTKDELIKALR